MKQRAAHRTGAKREKWLPDFMWCVTAVHCNVHTLFRSHTHHTFQITHTHIAECENAGDIMVRERANKGTNQIQVY